MAISQLVSHRSINILNICNARLKLCLTSREVHLTPTTCESTVGRYKVTPNRSRALTYEMANKPHDIGHRKGWNSFNTTSLFEGIREPETVVEDMFIRRFMFGTWHNLFVSEIIIKRQVNVIRIGGVVQQKIIPRKMYFLIGYTEELLSFWLKCPIKLEIQTVPDKKDVVYKYI